MRKSVSHEARSQKSSLRTYNNASTRGTGQMPMLRPRTHPQALDGSKWHSDPGLTRLICYGVMAMLAFVPFWQTNPGDSPDLRVVRSISCNGSAFPVVVFLVKPRERHQ